LQPINLIEVYNLIKLEKDRTKSIIKVYNLIEVKIINPYNLIKVEKVIKEMKA